MPPRRTADDSLEVDTSSSRPGPALEEYSLYAKLTRRPLTSPNSGFSLDLSIKERITSNCAMMRAAPAALMSSRPGIRACVSSMSGDTAPPMYVTLAFAEVTLLSTFLVAPVPDIYYV